MKKTFCSILTFLLFLIFCPDIAYSGANEDLISACRKGDLTAVNAAFGAGADVSAMDENGNSCLANAFFWPEITKALIDKGADPNAGGYPALIQASNNYSVEVVKLLIGVGADPNKAAMIDPGVGLRKMLEAEKAKGKKANKTTVDAWEAALKNMQPSKL